MSRRISHLTFLRGGKFKNPIIELKYPRSQNVTNSRENLLKDQSIFPLVIIHEFSYPFLLIMHCYC